MTDETIEICKCDDYEPGVNALDIAITSHYLRTGQDLGDIGLKKFKFCPWCSKLART